MPLTKKRCPAFDCNTASSAYLYGDVEESRFFDCVDVSEIEIENLIQHRRYSNA